MTLNNDDLFVVYRSTDVGDEYKKVTLETMQDSVSGPQYLLEDFSSYPSITTAFTAPAATEPADEIETSTY